MRFVIVFATVSLALLALAGAPVLAQDGQALYAAECAKCHGDTGQADTVVGKAMKTPPLAGTSLSGEQLGAVVGEDPKHASLKGRLSDTDLAAIAGFLPTLGGE